MTDDTESAATKQLQQELVETLDLTSLPSNAYRDPIYLEAAFDAGFEVADLARAHDVAKKSMIDEPPRYRTRNTTEERASTHPLECASRHDPG